MASADPSASAASEPSLIDALIHVFEVGQRLVLDRIDLTRFDLNQVTERVLRGVVLIVTGSVLLAGACFTALGGVVVWLQQYVSLVVSLAVVTGVSAGIGAGAIAIGIRRARGAGAASNGAEPQ